MRANAISKVLQFVVVSRRDQEADRVRGRPRGRIVDGRQFLTVFFRERRLFFGGVSKTFSKINKPAYFHSAK